MKYTLTKRELNDKSEKFAKLFDSTFTFKVSNLIFKERNRKMYKNIVKLHGYIVTLTKHKHNPKTRENVSG